MSLTTGRGPLSRNPVGRFSAPMPEAVTYVEPFRRRVRGVRNGETVVDSERVLLVHRPGQPPWYLFAADDVGDVAATPDPDAPGYVQVPWDAVDSWFEEEEQVSGHPRNPYHRIDCLTTTRHLRVEVEGSVLVDTTDTLALYETGLDPKLYVERDAVRMDLLVLSTTTTYCPYKGTAAHFNAVVGESVVEDVAWSYEDPLPESLPIRGLVSFYDSRASVVTDLPLAPAL